METINAKVPHRLATELELLVNEGWYGNRSEAVRDAIRNLVDRKRYQKMRQAVVEDIEWALHDR